MTVLDANAVIALGRDEPARGEVEALMRIPPVRLNAVNIAEVIDRLVRVWRWPYDEVIEDLGRLMATGLEIVDADFECAALAGFLRARYYGRRDRDLSTADCHALATAAMLEDAIATSDPALAATARDEGVEVVPLLDSSGKRPT